MAGDGGWNERSYARLTDRHLARLSELARRDHRQFTRPTGRPEYADRLLAVVLAQGGAQHYVDGSTGIKDLDVWRFYARVPGLPFREGQYETHADFGPSELGRQRYDMHKARDARERAKWERWQAGYTGRRVDHMLRVLDLAPSAPAEAVVRALRNWLAAGAMKHPDRQGRLPSAAHLAQKAMILLDPPHEEMQVWPPPESLPARGSKPS